MKACVYFTMVSQFREREGGPALECQSKSILTSPSRSNLDVAPAALQNSANANTGCTLFNLGASSTTTSIANPFTKSCCVGGPVEGS